MIIMPNGDHALSYFSIPYHR